MKNYVLVHGAWEFNKVIELLSVDGSNVINNLDEKGILVGYSLAGAIIYQVAEGIPEKIDRLIYVVNQHDKLCINKTR